MLLLTISLLFFLVNIFIAAEQSETADIKKGEGHLEDIGNYIIKLLYTDQCTLEHCLYLLVEYHCPQTKPSYLRCKPLYRRSEKLST